MTNTPSNTEIDNLLCKHWPGYSRQAVLVKMWLREAIESAIAQWGTPQPVVREQLTDEQWQRITDLTGGRILTQGVKDEIERVIGIKGGQHGAE